MNKHSWHQHSTQQEGKASVTTPCVLQPYILIHFSKCTYHNTLWHIWKR